jgi:hypothetical protein
LTTSFLCVINQSKGIFFKKCCEKGKPVVRRGAQSYGPLCIEVAELPNSVGLVEVSLVEGSRGCVLNLINLTIEVPWVISKPLGQEELREHLH